MKNEEKELHLPTADGESSPNETGDALPDFSQLEDRLIAPAPKGPFIRIRTNLDQETSVEEQ